MGIFNTLFRQDGKLRLLRLVSHRLKNVTVTEFEWIAGQMKTLSRQSVGSLVQEPEHITASLLALWDISQHYPFPLSEPKVRAIGEVISLINISRCLLSPDEMAQLEAAMRSLTRDDVDRLFAWDPWVSNFLHNVWEYVHGEHTLTSYPWNISLPIADVCNAKCTFCTSWLEGRQVLQLNQIENFAAVLRHAVYVGLVGHGEPLAHPQFPELCKKLQNLLDRRASCYTITNGVFLERWREHLDELNVDSYSISLNAASPTVHDEVMGLGPDAFPLIVQSITHLLKSHTRNGRRRQLYITMVVTQQNLHEVPAFIELGNRLGVTGIWLRTLLPQSSLIPGLNYHVLPPYFHPHFETLRSRAVEAINQSEVPVQADAETWAHPVLPLQFTAEIEQGSIPIITREKALKSKVSRERTVNLYGVDKTDLRGRPKSLDSFTILKWSNNWLRITTPAAQWAYAIQIPINVASPYKGTVSVSLTNTEGRIGVGLLDLAINAWIDRQFVGPENKTKLTLTSRSPAHLALVVENASEKGSSQTTLCQVRIVERTLDGGSSVERDLDWTRFHTHSPVDPLDDGTNPLNRYPRFACKAVYYNLYINELFFRVNPCCYMTEVPGFEEVRFDGSTDFWKVWNSPAMVELRRRLHLGPLFGACKRCPEKW